MTRSRIEELTGETFHEKRQSCPGSTTYYLENTEKKDIIDPASNYTDGELMNLQKYLPHSFSKHVYLGKSPEEIVKGDGWKWNDNLNVFQHEEFFDDVTKENIHFKGVLKSWNNERFLVPLWKEGVTDSNGLCWKYHNVSVNWSLEKNKPMDFWESRKGKQMARYIEYRKRRETRSNMLK